ARAPRGSAARRAISASSWQSIETKVGAPGVPPQPASVVVVVGRTVAVVVLVVGAEVELVDEGELVGVGGLVDRGVGLLDVVVVLVVTGTVLVVVLDDVVTVLVVVVLVVVVAGLGNAS